MTVRVVSRGELRETLRAHAENPDAYSGLRYYELPQVIDRDFYLSLDESHRAWYDGLANAYVIDPMPFGRSETGERTGRYYKFELQPGSYDAWVVET